MADPPRNHPLAGVVEKLRRSDHHLVSLYNETARYINGRSYGFIMQRDTGDGKPGIRFRVLKQPPLYLSAIIGDVVHNLRGSLDYIAHELSIRNGAKPTDKTQFPVSLTEDDFLHQAITLKKLNTVSVKALKLVSAFQPYQLDEGKRKNHPLWQLAKLSNVDKHRTLVLCAVGAKARTVFTHPDGRRIVSEFKDALVHDSAVVASFPADFFHEKIKTHFQAATRIAFTDAPMTDSEPVGVLQSTREFIGKLILTAFEPFFDQLPNNLRLRNHGLPPSVLAKAKKWSP